MADPIPYKHAMEQGCDRLVLLLTRPVDYRRPPLDHQEMMEKALGRWPNTFSALLRRAPRYNRDLAAVQELEREGKALIIAPSDIAGMDTLTRDKAAVERLYQMGYEQGPRLMEFVKGC